MADNGNLQTKEIFPQTQEDDTLATGFGFMRWMAGAGETISPWWSQERDRQLRLLVKNNDQLAGTVNMMQEMIGSVELRVEPRDNSVKAHRLAADRMTDVLLNKTESRSNLTANGWISGLSPFLNDLCSQDNGGWFVVEGESDREGKLLGLPTKLIHLDSYNCWRTRNVTYPLIYTDGDGKRYKIHRSRIVNITSSPDASSDMCGIGFCPVSRTINTIQRLMDISRYYQEKLGSRPPRGFLFVTGTGAERGAKAIENSVFITNEQMDNQGLSRFSRVPVIGLKDGSVELVTFSDMPDGFDEMTTTQLSVWVLSLAFGVDSRQLGFALGVAGQTKADAEVQHLKMRGKFPGWFIQELTRQLNYKFLPPYLKAVFDQQDDEQDRAQAEMRKVRSEYRKTYIETGLWTTRVAHEDMLEAGDITDAQFEELELGEGRLEDGTSLDSLFSHPDFVDLLITDNPTEQLQFLYNQLAQVNNTGEQKRLKLAIVALEQSSNKKQEEVSEERLSLNGAQVRALRDTLREVKDGSISRDNAIQVLVSLGIPQVSVEQMVDNALQGDTPVEEVIDEEVKKERTLDSTQFDMPPEIAREIINLGKQLKVIDLHESGLEDRPHITVKFGLVNSDINKLESIVSEFEPFEVTLGNISLFENTDFDVLKIDVESSELELLNLAITSQVLTSSKHLGYHPHLTIGYLKAGEGWKYWGLNNPLKGRKVLVDTLILSRKDKSETAIPLGSKKKALDSYQASIRTAVRGLFNEQISIIDFINAMNSTIERGFEQAWTEGALACGIRRDERTIDEINQLNRMIADNKIYVFQFGNWIETLRDADGLLSSAFSRVEIWVNRYNEVRVKATAMACADQKAEWVYGDTEHCRSCKGLNGRVYRYSVWNDNVTPRSRQLACKGYHCQCDLVPTDKRITPGRFPRGLLE